MILLQFVSLPFNILLLAMNICLNFLLGCLVIINHTINLSPYIITYSGLCCSFFNRALVIVIISLNILADRKSVV